MERRTRGEQRVQIPAYLIPDVPSRGSETNEKVCSVKSAMEIRGFPLLVGHDLSVWMGGSSNV